MPRYHATSKGLVQYTQAEEDAADAVAAATAAKKTADQVAEIAKANGRGLIQRRAKALIAKGDHYGALMLLKSIGE